MLRTYTTLVAAAMCATLSAAQAAGDPPLVLAKEGYFYVGGHAATIDGHQYVAGQMYTEFRIPAKQTHPYPIIMVHGGTMSGINYTGTLDGREGWAQYFVRRGYAVYVVDQPGRARSSYNEKVYGEYRAVDATNSLSRFTEQEKYKLWPQAHLHTQWPGTGAADDPAVQQLAASQLPAIADFDKQQMLNRDALVALLDKIGPSILLVHSQAGAFGWPVADARPNLVRAILAIEPNGPPFYDVQFVGAPDYFKQGKLALKYGITSDPLTYSPPVSDPAELAPVEEAKADAPDKVRCWLQKEPARQLPNLQKMPILVLTSEASYHAPYDHCTVKYLRQAGVQPSVIRLADIGIHGNSHVMMLEKNNKDIAAVIGRWLDKSVPKGSKTAAAH
ncbi:MAG TPA: alpha/beta hydrolase [Alphaproteobacteria bacterium]|nr:alpha/beta hydrolase [Alphaproteobacteria bacterium]